VIHRGEDPLERGAELEFTLWLGIVPVRWLARIEAIDGVAEEEGFLDRQVRGPFKSWTHTHRFEPLGPRHTMIDDRIEAELSLHPLHTPVGAAMWSGLPIVFRWRAWRTRRLLEGPVVPVS
jgi:ligand-binding SRPBCC domain-containing protein